MMMIWMGSQSWRGDCDDVDFEVFPYAIEECDGIDEDCDGVIDNDTDCFDDDGDGYTEDNGDCDDYDASINPIAVEVFNGIDENCDGVIDENTIGYDDDGDGYTEIDGDCDDAAMNVNLQQPRPVTQSMRIVMVSSIMTPCALMTMVMVIQSKMEIAMIMNHLRILGMQRYLMALITIVMGISMRGRSIR